MNALQEEAVSILRELISICRDGQEGFRAASEHLADDPELKTLLSSFSLQRAKFAGDLEAQVITLGVHHPEHEQRTITAAAHRGWVHLKSVLASKDRHSILTECERSEDFALEAYNKALSHHLPEPIHQIVHEQRQEIVSTHNTIRALRDGKPYATAEAFAYAAERKVGEQTRRAQAEVGAAWGSLKERANEVRLGTEGYVRENPLPSLVGALLTGFSIGMIFYAVELRNERQRSLVRLNQAPLKRFSTGIAGALGYLAGQARTASQRAVEAVQRYDNRPTLAQGRATIERASRPIQDAWNRFTGGRSGGKTFIGSIQQR